MNADDLPTPPAIIASLDANAIVDDTASQVSTAADKSDAAAASSLNTSLGGSSGIGSDYVASMRASAGAST